MVSVPLGKGAYATNEYGLPLMKLENWYAEAMPQFGQVRLLPTPGLTLFQAASTGVRGIFQSDGILSGQIVYADGTSLERLTVNGVNTDIATVASDNYRAQFAASQAELVVASGGTAYKVESGSVTPITVGTASGDIVSVAEVGQRHLFVEDESGRFWWSDVADCTTVSNTSFATAESEPDNLLSVQVFRGSVYLFGTQTVEAWVATGNQNRAFVARPGAVLPTGLIGRDAVCQSDDAMFMVANSGLILRLDGLSRTRVSTTPIEELIKDISLANQRLVKLSSYQWRGHEFIRVTIPNRGAWNYDISTGLWHRAKTNGVQTHIVDDFVSAYGSSYAAGAGGIYSTSNSVYTEAGEEVRRVADAFLPIPDGRPAISKATIYTSVVGVPASGQGSTPQAMFTVFRDGVTAENEIIRDLPTTGEYAGKLEFGPLGRGEPPIIKFEIAVSDPVGLTLSDLNINMARS